MKKTRIYDFESFCIGSNEVGCVYYAEGRINGRTYVTRCTFNNYTKTEIIDILKDELRKKANQNA